MDRTAIGSIALALVGVVAVAVAAATLTATVSPGSGGFGTNASEGDGLLPPPEEPPDGEPVSLPIPPSVLSILAAVTVALAVWFFLVDRRHAVRVVAVVVAALAALVLMGWLLRDLLATGGPLPSGMPRGLLPRSEGGGLSVGVVERSPPSPLLLLLIGVLVLGSVGVLAGASRRIRGGDRGGEPGTGDDAAAAAVGRAAGRAADRIERNAPADNEVYRAWREMTDYLQVDDPETSTPGEFATAAVEAGMTSEDVERLTRLFERARYGGDPVTDETESRAVRTLRRIEAAYSGDDDA